MYSRQVLEHFQNTRNVGELPDADAYVRVDNPACGDVLQLSIKLKRGRISEAKFRARGCVCAIACGSQLTEMIGDLTPAQAQSLRCEDLVKALGGLPDTSMHAAALAMEALTLALRQIAGQQRT
ncbi:MAG: iron-sulfur cluster assembly scaffold protein [Terriglobales bacterium]